MRTSLVILALLLLAFAAQATEILSTVQLPSGVHVFIFGSAQFSVTNNSLPNVENELDLVCDLVTDNQFVVVDQDKTFITAKTTSLTATRRVIGEVVTTKPTTCVLEGFAAGLSNSGGVNLGVIQAAVLRVLTVP